MIESRRSNLLAKQLAEGKLGIIFVGMSNVGKSYQTKKLAEPCPGVPTFRRICVDDEIETALAEQMKADGVEGDGIAAVAEWMGSPHADDNEVRERYSAREQVYLELESQSYRRLLSLDHDSAWAIDTTGSFVHCPDSLQRDLASMGLVVYIEATEADIDDMFRRYKQHPKPLCWAGIYSQLTGESVEQAVERSYRKLLELRIEGYRKIADMTLAKNDVRQTADAAQLLKLIGAQLR